MKKHIIKICFLTTLFLSYFNNAHSQTDSTRWMIMYMPQYLINNGIRLDIERKMKNVNTWIVVSPQLFANYNKNTRFDEDYHYNKLIGAGLDISIKRFLIEKHSPKGIYISTGLDWVYTDISLTRPVWINTTENNLNYILPANKEYNQKINRIGINGTLGYETAVIEGLYIDVFVGFGLRYSVYDSPYEPIFKFNEHTWDYGYTGTCVVAGFKIGIGL